MREQHAIVTLVILFSCFALGHDAIAASDDVGTGRVTGRVLMLDDTPVTGATVVLEARESEYPPSTPTVRRSATTGSDGAFEFAGLPFGDYVFQVNASGKLGLGAARLKKEHPESDVRIDLLAGGPIAGRVVDADGVAVAGAWVAPVIHDIDDHRTYGGWSAILAVRSGQDGRFRLDRVWNNAWRLVVYSEGYAPVLTPYFHVGEVNASIVVKPASSIQGNVVHGQTGDPLPGVKVMLSGENDLDKAEIETDDHGTFRFDNLRPVAHKLRVEHQTLAPERPFKSVKLTEGEHASGVTFTLVEGGRIEGYVTDTERSEGIPGVTVAVSSADGKTAVTDDFGHYEIAGLSKGTYNVSMYRKSGYQYKYERRLVSVSLDATARDVDFALAPSTSPITGVVLKPDGTHALQDAVVHAQIANDSRLARVESDGTFSLDGVEPGQEFVLWARNEGGLLFPPGEPIVMPEGGIANVVIELEEGARITGRAIDESGEPVPYPRISIQSLDYPFQNLGLRRMEVSSRFSIVALPPGTYTLWAENRKEGYHSQKQTIRLGTAESVDSVLIRCEWEKIYTISGRVIDDGGNPVRRAMVKVAGNPNTFTNATGFFKLTLSKPGSCQISVYHEDYPEWTFAETSAGARNVELVLRRGGVIEGRVVWADSGRPVTDFSIATFEDDSSGFLGHVNPLNTQSMERVVDEEGRFRLTGLRPGALKILIKAGGLGPALQTIDGINNGEVLRGIVLRMLPGAVIQGRVTDADGNPLQNVLVLARSTAGSAIIGERPMDVPAGTWKRQQYSQAAITDIDGKFRARDLGEGVLDIAAFHPDFIGSVERVSLQSGATRPLDFILVPGAELTGLVTLHGRPVAGAELSLRAYQRVQQPAQGLNSGSGRRHVGRWESVSGPDGRYTVGGLPACDLDIEVKLAINLDGGMVGTLRRTTRAESQIANQGTVELDIDFSGEGAEMHGTITVDGVAPRMARISVKSANDDGSQDTFLLHLRAGGEYSIRGIPLGVWSVNVDTVIPQFGSDSHALKAPMLIELTRAGRKRVDFRFP